MSVNRFGVRLYRAKQTARHLPVCNVILYRDAHVTAENKRCRRLKQKYMTVVLSYIELASIFTYTYDIAMPKNARSLGSTIMT